jgi:radical SAM protein with 4Fe4S-binding SPASM domain
MPPTECSAAETRGSYLVVEHDGAVYSCDLFVEPDRCLGNLHETPLPDLFAGKRHGDFCRSRSRAALSQASYGGS